MPITKATPNVISPISTTNLANSIVLRDASGNFSAGTITAALSGNATTATTATTAGTCTGNSATATKLATARTIALTGSVTGSANFDGSANISITTTGGGGGASSAKAWVNFNGTTSPGTIRSSFNVSSVTKLQTGDYTVNFTTAVGSTDYSVTSNAATSQNNFGATAAYLFSSAGTTIRTYGLSGANADFSYISVQVFAN
jgi:hypothetical protein